MSNIPNSPDNPGPSSENPAFIPSDYELRITGHLGPQIAAWFEDMTLIVNEETSPPQTIIRGHIVDQAALYGLINRARDLGLTLLSVKRIDVEGNRPQDLEVDASGPIEDSVLTEDT